MRRNAWGWYEGVGGLPGKLVVIVEESPGQIAQVQVSNNCLAIAGDGTIKSSGTKGAAELARFNWTFAIPTAQRP